MRNPFENLLHKRGLPDSAVHAGYSLHDQQQQPDASEINPVSAPPPHPATPPLGYPPHSSDPATACPYASQSDNQGSSGAEFEVNTGHNTNLRGQQQGGNIRVGNAEPGSAPLVIPQNGRFVLDTGYNVNEGYSQVSGGIDFANVEFQQRSDQRKKIDVGEDLVVSCLKLPAYDHHQGNIAE